MGAYINALSEEGTFVEVAKELIQDIKENSASGLHSEYTVTLAFILERKIKSWQAQAQSPKTQNKGSLMEQS